MQINRVTSWIDGSFIYSTSEAWINAMRSFKNGTLLSEPTNGFPVRNTMRVPLFNNPVPNILRTLSPERLFREHRWRDNITVFTNRAMPREAMLTGPYYRRTVFRGHWNGIIPRRIVSFPACFFLFSATISCGDMSRRWLIFKKTITIAKLVYAVVFRGLHPHTVHITVAQQFQPIKKIVRPKLVGKELRP